MHRKRIAQIIVVTAAGFLFMMSVQWFMRPYAVNGMYYQAWPSDFMMQTVSIEDLRDAPFQSLWNLHIEPPALDAIRAVFSGVWASQDLYAMLKKVDQSLYVLWAILYGLLGALIYSWLSERTRTSYAVAATVVFLLHPAGLYYATFLDGTFLATVLITWAYYLLWRLRNDPRSSIGALCIAVLALFFTRPIFQWPAVVVFASSLFLLRVPARQLMIFIAVCGAVVGLYMGKQYYQFGTTSTTSFTGYNLARSTGFKDQYWYYLSLTADTAPGYDPSLPSVLTREKKFLGIPNFNNIRYLEENQYLINAYKEHLVEMTMSQLAANYLENARIYFLPSSQYHDVFKGPVNWHAIVDRLPWRGLYDRIFSFPVLPALFLFAGIHWLITSNRGDYAAGLAMLLPGAFIFFATVLFEKGENMRFKFFLEPVFFVFLSTQLFAFGRTISRTMQSLNNKQ